MRNARTRVPSYTVCIDLTKTFHLISKNGPFKILERIGCPGKLLTIMKSSHKETKGTTHYNVSTSDAFEICSAVKQDCVVAPNVFWIFTVLVELAFGDATQGVYHTHGQMESISIYYDWKLNAKCKTSSSDTPYFQVMQPHAKNNLQNMMNLFCHTWTFWSYN